MAGGQGLGCEFLCLQGMAPPVSQALLILAPNTGLASGTPDISSSSLYSRPSAWPPTPFWVLQTLLCQGQGLWLQATGHPLHGTHGCDMYMCVYTRAGVAYSSFCLPSSAPHHLPLIVPDVLAVATTCHVLEMLGLPLRGLAARGCLRNRM